MAIKGKLKQKTGSNTSEILHPETDASVVTYSGSVDGTAVSDVKSALDALAAGTGVTGVKGNEESTYRKGQVNITPANIGAIPTSEKGAASGVATLDSNGKVNYSQLPDTILGQLKYGGALYIADSDATKSSYAKSSLFLSMNQKALDWLGITGSDSVTVNEITASGGNGHFVTFSDFSTAASDNAEKAIGMFFIVGGVLTASQTIGAYVTIANKDITSGSPYVQQISTGDWLIIQAFTGTSPFLNKIDNTDAVTMVNGMLGAVTLYGGNLPYASAADSNTIKDKVDEALKPTIKVIESGDVLTQEEVDKFVAGTMILACTYLATGINHEAALFTYSSSGSKSDGSFYESSVWFTKPAIGKVLGTTFLYLSGWFIRINASTRVVTILQTSSSGITISQSAVNNSETVASAKCVYDAVSPKADAASPTAGTYSAVTVNGQGIVTAGGQVLEVIENGATPTVANGGWFFEKDA